MFSFLSRYPWFILERDQLQVTRQGDDCVLCVGCRILPQVKSGQAESPALVHSFLRQTNERPALS